MYSERLGSSGVDGVGGEEELLMMGLLLFGVVRFGVGGNNPFGTCSTEN